MKPPTSLLATGRGCCVSGDVRRLPAADCRAGYLWVGFELPTHGVKQHLFAVDHRSLQHARYSSECPG